MIQRQQTLWLLLATACAVLSFFFPFAKGDQMIKDMKAGVILDAASTLPLLLLTGASAILSVVTIFYFKDRKMQWRLCFLGILITLGIILLYIKEYKGLTDSVLALYCVLPALMLISYYMAYRGIRKDHKLVKSLDKLR